MKKIKFFLKITTNYPKRSKKEHNFKRKPFLAFLCFLIVFPIQIFEINVTDVDMHLFLFRFKCYSSYFTCNI